MSKLITTKYLVIGGSGFIGCAVVNRLAQIQGARITVAAKSIPSETTKVEGVSYVSCDLTKFEELKALFANNFDYIVNAAGNVDHQNFTSNGCAIIKQHFSSLLDQFRLIDKSKLKRYLYIGSADEYPDCAGTVSESLREEPSTPYAFAKTAAAHFLQMLHRSEQIPTVVVRVFLTYGPNQGQNRFIPQIIEQALTHNEIKVSSGEQIRDFCHVDDVANGLIDLLHAPDIVNGRIVNLGSSIPTSLKSIVQHVQNKTNAHVLFGAIDAKPHERKRQVANTLLLRTLISWSPTITLEDGLNALIANVKAKK